MNVSRRMLALFAVAMAALALAACGGGGDDDTTAGSSGGGAATAPTNGEGDGGSSGAGGKEQASVPTIVIREGEPVGGIQELEFDAGDEIRFRVSSDAAEEIHIHGYDIAKEVPAGGTVEFDFPAEIEGIFEAELEEMGVQIAELRVNP